MGGKSMDDKAVKVWCEWFERHCSSLAKSNRRAVAREVNFSENRITSIGVECICKTFVKLDIPVSVLKLYKNQIEKSDGIVNLLSWSKGCVKEMHLSHNSLDTKAAHNIIMACVNATNPQGEPCYPRDGATLIWLRMEMNDRINGAKLGPELQDSLRRIGKSVRSCICEVEGTSSCCPGMCCRAGSSVAPVHLTYMRASLFMHVGPERALPVKQMTKAPAVDSNKAAAKQLLTGASFFGWKTEDTDPKVARTILESEAPVMPKSLLQGMTSGPEQEKLPCQSESYAQALLRKTHPPPVMECPAAPVKAPDFGVCDFPSLGAPAKAPKSGPAKAPKSGSMGKAVADKALGAQGRRAATPQAALAETKAAPQEPDDDCVPTKAVCIGDATKAVRPPPPPPGMAPPPPGLDLVDSWEVLDEASESECSSSAPSWQAHTAPKAQYERIEKVSDACEKASEAASESNDPTLMLAVYNYQSEANGYVSVAKGDHVRVWTEHQAPGDPGCTWSTYVFAQVRSMQAGAEICTGWIPFDVAWERYVDAAGRAWAHNPSSGDFVWEDQIRDD